MCGGRVEILPCSHITHLERKRSVYSRKTVGRNNARLAAVWLDEFAPFYFSRAGKKYVKLISLKLALSGIKSLIALIAAITKLR